MQTGARSALVVVKAVARLDDRLGSALDLVVDAPHVFAHHAEAEQLDAAEQRHDDHDGGVADWEVGTGELGYEVANREQESDSREDDAAERDELERVTREADDSVHPDH